MALNLKFIETRFTKELNIILLAKLTYLEG